MASHAQTVLTHSPALFLRLSDSGATAVDVSGNGRNGTYSGTYTLGQTDPLIGDGDKAAYLQQASPFGTVSVPHDPLFNLTTTSTDRWSIELLFATPLGVAPSASFPRLISKGSSGSTGWGLYVSAGGGTLNFRIGGTGNAVGPGAISWTSAFTHVIVTFDGTKLTAYINGAAQSPVTPAALSSSDTGPLYLNQENGNNPGDFVFDEVAVYKTALTAADVTALYGSLGNAPTGTAPAYSGSLALSATGTLTLARSGASAPLTGTLALSTTGTLTLSGSSTVQQLRLTLTPDPTSTPPRIRIDVSDTRTVPATQVTISRQDPSGQLDVVRTSDGGPLPLTGGTATIYDYLAPFGVPLTYSTDVAEGGTATGELDVDRPWLQHPGIPSRSMTFRQLAGSLAQEVWDIDQGAFQVLGRSTPVVTTGGARTAPAGTLVVGTSGPDELAALRLLLSDGAPLYLNVPPSLRWGVDNAYIAVGRVQVARPSPILVESWRSLELPYQVVARPAGGTRGGVTWADIASRYATWADVKATGLTWAELVAQAG